LPDVEIARSERARAAAARRAAARRAAARRRAAVAESVGVCAYELDESTARSAPAKPSAHIIEKRKRIPISFQSIPRAGGSHIFSSVVAQLSCATDLELLAFVTTGGR
jgi:hypothetical protein